MRMNECSHPPTTTPILPAHPLHLPALLYTTFIPHSLPLLSTAGLCYDCSWCVITHIAVSTAPPWGHPYKGLSFPKVRSEPCTQVLSRHLVWRKEKRKKKTACPYSLSVCLQWAWLLRPVSWVSFLFVFFPSSSSLLSCPFCCTGSQYVQLMCLQPRGRLQLLLGMSVCSGIPKAKCDTAVFKRALLYSLAPWLWWVQIVPTYSLMSNLPFNMVFYMLNGQDRG